MPAPPAGDPATPLPAHIREQVERTCGPLTSVEPSHGMSGASVFIARGTRADAIVKGSPLPAEAWFYREVAPHLRARDVPIPAVELLGAAEGRHWLLVEYLPVPLAAGLSPWKPDQRVINGLAALHRATRGGKFDIPHATRADWTPAATARAVAAFSPVVRPELTPTLVTLQHQAAHLTEPWCWISGDPSPPNWAARLDGTLMLFDWELFRPGIPAADLAPVAPGLATRAEIARVAESYAGTWTARGGERLPWTVDQLTRDTIIAKIATVVVLLAEYRAGGGNIPGDFARKLIEAFPAWLRSLVDEHG